MSRGLTFQLDGFYHLYNRGTEKREIFLCEDDRQRFVALLYHANCTEPVHLQTLIRGSTSITGSLESARGDPLVDLCAYCLMPNHFHLLVRERCGHGISSFMQKLSTAYTMYFNTRYERSGALFQGKFKAQDANDDRYLRYLVAYIHLNPVSLIEPKWREMGIRDAAGAMRFLRLYPYSSYREYAGESRIESKLIAKGVLPVYFEKPSDFENMLTDWLHYRNS